ncbi:MAG: MBL fold metallo-hydrolase [Telluria sp.]
MIVKQLHEPLSDTYTYLLACETTGHALLIDPVISMFERDLAEVRRLGLKLAYTVDTHIHADHITGALELKRATGSRIATPALDRLPCTDIPIEENVPFRMGEVVLNPLHTPGHTDFQNGDSATLFRSVREKLFVLPGEVLVYPAHDYTGRHVLSIAQEKARNPRLGTAKTLEEFQDIMANLKLPYPKFIDYAVPGNRLCGVCPPDVPESLDGYCRHMPASPQG